MNNNQLAAPEYNENKWFFALLEWNTYKGAWERAGEFMPCEEDNGFSIGFTELDRAVGLGEMRTPIVGIGIYIDYNGDKHLQEIKKYRIETLIKEFK